MKLTIISHTEHFKTSDGKIVGLGSTVTEINHLLKTFDAITHVAMLHKGSPPSSALPYSSEKIDFVALPVVGGHSLTDKLGILWNIPRILKTIRVELGTSDYFQFRAPTGIGVFVIPYLILFVNKNGWFKYAGNWKQKHPPLAYGFQRWLLKVQKKPVTINGIWPNQPKHCLSFENPCLTTQEIKEGSELVSRKEKNKTAVQICFVGRLEEAKGLDILIEAIDALSDYEKKQIELVHIVGDGALKHHYMEQAQKTRVPFEFYGFMPRLGVHAIYKKSHAILLPSASEGFPKVIAEAMNYGCLPIVSNVSSISHYVSHMKNGFLLDSIDSESTLYAIRKLLQLTSTGYASMTRFQDNKMERFTYAYYNSHILKDIL